MSKITPEIEKWAYGQIKKKVASGDFDCDDSYRVGISPDDPDFVNARSCCGEYEWSEIGPDGKTYFLGFNYGH